MLRGRLDGTRLFRSAMVLIAAGALYASTFLVAFQPGDHYSYFPSLGELPVTTGLVSLRSSPTSSSFITSRS